ncbi:MAG: hypothetical protein AUK55_00815 [Syntrophobacteraceae bacterium CG2_30_61_12]|nr:MAG: hypothetical protein AUK55_00815 [Syntrophobacteraceae bacterium CG2_30_61_12]
MGDGDALAFGHGRRGPLRPAPRMVRLAIGILAVVLIGTPEVRAADALIRSAPRSGAAGSAAADASESSVLLAIGDSLSHGTMDGAVNGLNTLHGYVQLVAAALERTGPIQFSQPLLDFDGNRISPFQIPTNLAVDGADLFSIEGFEYYRRVGANASYLAAGYLGDALLPRFMQDLTDRVLYPVNLLAGQAVSQVDAALELMDRIAASGSTGEAILLFWAGNNDTSLAALGSGGANPSYLPFPLEQISPELKPALRVLLETGARRGELSFSPYTLDAIARNMTTVDDFAAQLDRVIRRLLTESVLPAERSRLFALTLPYYSAVGYLLDSDDLEFYLGKLAPGYRVPASFQRVSEPGQPISDPFKGDRVSLFTFGFMYALLETGYSVAYVNEILERDGVQQDGLVLSESEARLIMDRIDAFNRLIGSLPEQFGDRVRVIDTGGYLNAALAGAEPVLVGGRALSRKWGRGNAFTLDGVHPGYTGHALIANKVLESLNAELGVRTSPYDLAAVMVTDVYVDRDGDGWVTGPEYTPTGLTELLFLFRDPDDADPAVQVDLPDDVWDRISDILLQELH